MRSEANIDGKIQGDTMVSYQMETTKDLQSAFVTTKEEKKKITGRKGNRNSEDERRKASLKIQMLLGVLCTRIFPNKKS